MDDKFFDKKIKTALDHIEAPYDAGSWAVLEQRLNAPLPKNTLLRWQQWTKPCSERSNDWRRRTSLRTGMCSLVG